MSPAVADFQSKQPHAHGPPLPNFQIPSPSFATHCQGEFQAEATDSNTVDGFNDSKFVSCSSRTRRRHKKVKKQVGSRNGFVQTTPLFPVPPTSDSVNYSFSDDLIASIGANSSGSMSKLNLGESVGRSSSGGDFERFVNIGFVVGASSSVSAGTAGPSGAGGFENFEEMGFVFGASKDCSSLNADSIKLQKNSNVDRVGAKLVNDSSTVDFPVSGNEKLEDSELRANEFGKFSMGCAFNAIKSDGVSKFNAENKDRAVSGYELGVGSVMLGASERNALLNSKKANGQSGVSPSITKVETFIEERDKAEDDGRSRNKMFSNLDFVFSASLKDSMPDANLREEGIKENGGDSVSVRRTEKSCTGVVSADSDDVGFVFPENSNSSDGENSKYTESWGKFGDACFKFGATPCNSLPTGNIEEKEFRSNLENLDFVEGKRSIDVETKVQGKVMGVSEVGNGCDASSTSTESRKLFDGMNNSKLNGEVDIDIGSDLKNKFNFVFVSMNNLSSDCMPVSNISDEMQALNLHDHAKVNAADISKDYNFNQGANTFNVFMFGSDRKNVSSTGSATTNSWDQHNDISKAGLGNCCATSQNEGVNSVHAFGNNENTDEAKKTEGASMGHSLSNNGNVGLKVLHEGLESCGVTENENLINLNKNSLDGGQIPGNQPKTDTELKFESFPSSSSSSGLSFQPEVSPSEAPASSKVEMTNNYSFTSTPVGFEAPFTGFSSPDLFFSYSFTANLVPDLIKNLEFSLNSSVEDKGLKKTRRKYRQQNLVRQRVVWTNILKEGEFQQNQESPGCCSPMDFSPYQDTNCEPSSTKSTELTKERDEVFDDGKLQFSSPSTSTNSVEGNFKFSASAFTQGEVSSTKPRHQKKYKMKISHGVNSTTSSRKVNISNEQSTGGNISDADGKHSRQERTDAIHDKCQKWRIRGNQAYKDGDLLKAETCYTKGVHSITQSNKSGFCSEALVLCYSNRAATRISLGRLREALEDCKMAASLDPTFIKVHLRAANCHLVLGEVEDAICNYNKCLETVTMVCLDRRFTIEAADGQQKAQKVVNCRNQSAELLRHKTFDSAAKALGVISEALAISCYSEKLLELKGEALLLLRKHEDVIQLCEQSLAFAETNFTTVGVASPVTNVDGFDSYNSPKLWRWGLLSRSYFSLGRLDRALDLIEKQEKLRHGGCNHESLSILAVTIRELLHCKNAGNEAFQSGRHTEAIEHYTTAISKSVESRPFSAVCICNRAAAHQAQGELIDAIADCSLAIALDGNYSKALSRRATLHETIRDYDEAANDLRRLISILEKQSIEKSQQSGTPDKSTGSSVKDLRRSRRRLSVLEEKAKKRMPLDLYLILGLKASDSSSEVKKAYRKAALRHHPDKAGQFLLRSDCGGDEQQWKEILETIHMDADRLFKMIGEANAVLSDSTKRSKYDVEEEIRRDDQENSGSSSSYGRSSNYYSSPFESSNRRSQEWKKAYGDSRYWQESWKTYGNSYSTRW